MHGPLCTGIPLQSSDYQGIIKKWEAVHAEVCHFEWHTQYFQVLLAVTIENSFYKLSFKLLYIHNGYRSMLLN